MSAGGQRGERSAILLNNALKFTPSGGRVTVTAKRTEKEVHLAVADAGPGIPADKQELIFDAFQQAPEP